MKRITWDNITVSQFIRLNQIGKEKEIDDATRAEETIKILFDLTDMQLDEMSIKEFNQYSKSCADVLTVNFDSNIKPKKIIKGKNKKYFIIYDPCKLTHRQFAEIQFFSTDMINNIHMILASIVQPIGKFGRRLKNTAEQHESISEDLLDAKIIDVYGSCVFFCKLYRNSLNHIKDYLINRMMKMGAKKEQALLLLETSINSLDGSIIQKRSQNLKELV
jgi:hypothetical protein